GRLLSSGPASRSAFARDLRSVLRGVCEGRQEACLISQGRQAMVTPRLSDLIRAAADQPPPPGVPERLLLTRVRLLRELPACRHSRQRRDALLRELLWLYQNGHRSLWAPLLLEA